MSSLHQILTLLCAKPKTVTRIVNRTSSKLQANLEKFDNGDISKKTFRSRSKKILDSAYRDAYMSGGGVSAISEAGEDWLGDALAEQFDFLDGFADDIDAGIGTMEYDTRMDQYAQAVKSAYYSGSVMEADEGELFDWV